MLFDIAAMTTTLTTRRLKRHAVWLTDRICLTPVVRSAEVWRLKAALAQADCGECRINAQLNPMPIFTLMVDPVR